ncbi:MAG: hypothetical protein U5N85_11585 [Arcicella sp.]|nr:hypothetical protein [Arcicella sp.]
MYVKKIDKRNLFIDNKLLAEDIGTFIFDGKNIVYDNQKPDILIYDLLNKKMELLLPEYRLGEILFSNYRTHVGNRINQIRETVFYDYKERKAIFINSPLPTHEVNGNLLFEQPTNTTLKSINLETGTYNWEVDLSVYISSVLGVFGNQLWIYTGTDELMSLALDTGQVLQRIRSNDLHPAVSNANLVANAVHFEAIHGRVTFLKDRDYLEFDLATCQVIRQKSFDTGNPYTDWAFSVSSLDDDYCYFVGNQGRDAGFAQWVGVLNRKTLEVEWSEHLGKQNQRDFWALTKAPISDGNKLYIHDSEGTLHIFEKEENA